MKYIENIKDYIRNSIEAKKILLSSSDTLNAINSAIEEIVKCYKKNHKLLICGNGGSAADAQHISAELTGRFAFDRKPLPAIALHTNTSHLTAVSNDYSFEKVFSRLVSAYGNSGDILIAISTSGNSKNIINAAKTAKEKNIVVISLTGNDGGALKHISDINININHNITAIIQECHIITYHIICKEIERELFGE